jgi:hypothetical protein
MSPSIVELPARAGSLRFSDEDVIATMDLLTQAKSGQAVQLTDAPDEKDNTARRRAEVMKEQIEEKIGDTPIKPGYKLRGHVVTAGEPKIEGKYKRFPQNWGALSLVRDDSAPESEPDAAPEVPEATDEKGKKGGK